MRLRFLRRREYTDTLSEYAREVQAHRDGLNLMQQRDAAIKDLRDAEPVFKCANPHPMGGECGMPMPRGDYRCGACLTPNPHYVDRGLEPIRIRDIWGPL